MRSRAWLHWGPINVVILHEMPSQADILREAPSAHVADEVPTTAAFVFEMLREAVDEFVTSSALRTLHGHVVFGEVIRVARSSKSASPHRQ